MKLHLDGLRLSADDFESLGRVKTLRVLSLRRANVTDEDLRQLQSLKKLDSLILTSTEVSDRSVVEITKLESLRMLCMVEVNVTPEAIGKLKAHFEANDRRRSLGYLQRKAP